ncbi:hypothetical protein [Mycobacterium sp. IDR2000157661]|uniref:hypothetical protein n=1 Tax=Mycobacterium sp. IDR2000157661 TaxID=2867005 RepID=UPI001EEB4AFD|nr:hypothetical protein [Mycobacterium sp. IDR2000157661]ULE33266.1 hypothetical protein K3G64_25040 [Mycobacterium sp. IDR2000157661]
MSHKHPLDAAGIALFIEAVSGAGRPFSSRHRIVDARGRVRPVLVIAERMFDPPGDIRERADHLLLTARHRIHLPARTRSDAC